VEHRQIYRSRASFLYLGVIFLLFLQGAERLYFFEQYVPASVYAIIPAIALATWFIYSATSGTFSVSRSTFNYSALLLLLPVLSVSLQSIFLTDVIDEFERSSLAFVREIHVFNAVWLMIGVALGSIPLRKKPLFPLILFLIFAFFIIQNLDGLSLDYARLRSSNDVERFSHQWISYNFLICAVLLYSQLNNRLARTAVIVATLTCQVFVGGRTILLLTTLVFFYIEGFTLGAEGSKRRPLKTLSMSIGTLAIVALAIVLLYLRDPDTVLRAFALNELQHDKSLIERDAALQIGLANLPRQFWIGDPTLVSTSTGSLGLYIHNALSGWQFYGFPFFVAFCVSLVHCLRKALRLKRKGSDDASFRFKFTLFLIALGGAITSLSVTHYFLWFTIGLCLARHPTQANQSETRRKAYHGVPQVQLSEQKRA